MSILHIKDSVMSKIGWGCALGGLLVSSCSLDIPLEDQYSDPEAVATVENARSLLTSAYIYYPHTEYDLSVLGPDFCPSSLLGKDSDLKNLYNWQDNAISKMSQTVWLDYYNVISVCDILQERLPMVLVEDESDQYELDAVKAESLTMEAMCYFNLLRLFAPAYDLNPQAEGVVLKNRVGVEFPKRSSLEDCVKNIRALLDEALKTDNMAESNGWLSNMAARYLLAEVELYAGNYAEAARHAEKVLEVTSARYFSERAYDNIWYGGSCDERIFAFSISEPVFVSLQYDSDLGDYLAVSPEISFAENDYRKDYALYPFAMSGEEHNLLGKYNKANKEGRKYSYLNVMRYAGAYFIAAEAYSHLEGQESKAIALMNEYLAYCGADLLPETLSGEELTRAILNEKLKEFVGEGVAYFDCKRLHNLPLMRWNKWGKMASSQIETTDYRWTFPIPASEYKNNENVNQNEGWPINR